MCVWGGFVGRSDAGSVSVAHISVFAYSTLMTSSCFNNRWNPAVEEQAIDRAHRIGQTEDVKVSRLVKVHTGPPRYMCSG